MVDVHTIVQCRRCRLVCVQQAPRMAHRGDYYGRMDHEAFIAYYRELRLQEADEMLRMLNTLGVNTGRLLDVGCSYGWFLQRAAKVGFVVTGLEPSQELARLAREHEGLRVLVGDVTTLDTVDEQFEVIALLDVLEHLPHPAQALALIRRRLAPGGGLLLRLPSVDGFIHRAAFGLHAASFGRIRAPLEALAQVENDFMHLFFFSPATLKALLAKAGFRIAHQEGCKIVETGRLKQRAQLSPRRVRYGTWETPLMRIGLDALQTAGRWTGIHDGLVMYATPL